MNREIKFKGKALTGGKWIYGSLNIVDKSPIAGKPICFIRNQDTPMTAVDPDTVGQFTGLKDKNGVEIYEGDLLKGRSGKVQGLWMVNFDDAKFVVRTLDCINLKDLSDAFEREDSHVVVVGNIHDNPELLP